MREEGSAGGKNGEEEGVQKVNWRKGREVEMEGGEESKRVEGREEGKK